VRNLDKKTLDKSCWRVGIDRKNHLFLPWEEDAICGAHITQSGYSYKYTCYECSCTLEGGYWGMNREESLRKGKEGR